MHWRRLDAVDQLHRRVVAVLTVDAPPEEVRIPAAAALQLPGNLVLVCCTDMKQYMLVGCADVKRLMRTSLTHIATSLSVALPMHCLLCEASQVMQ